MPVTAERVVHLFITFGEEFRTSMLPARNLTEIVALKIRDHHQFGDLLLR